MSHVEVWNLHVAYASRKGSPVHAVKGISFAIPRGEVFGFIGPNGAGKTSTIKVLATLLRPTDGWVRIDGIGVVENPGQVRRRIGYVPDTFGVYEDLTAREYLHFFGAAYGIWRTRRHGLVRDVLALTDLTEKVDAPVDSLSRGMKQRLGLARVLLHDPDVLLLDEPASGLDPRARIEMRELLKELKGMGKTILISSHILHELGQLCTRIGIIEAGEMAAEGPLEEIYRKLGLLRVVHLQASNLTGEHLAGIGALPGVEGVEREADRLSIRVDEARLALEDLLAAIVSLGARVRMFQPEAMDLETVFMKLTRGKTA